MLNNGMTPQNALFVDDDGQVYSLINLIKDISSNSNGGNFTPQEKEKLENIEENANNYVHPENHEPSIITQDNEHRFVTDTEKETWNNKLSEHQDISHLAVKSEVDESLSQINQSNIERDKKISSIENINSVQNAKLDTLFNSASGEMELESNSNNIKLDSSKKGTTTVDYIKGNTLVNCAKENKELILNDEINVEGTYCTINDTVEGGLVDVELEGLSLNNLFPNIQFSETVNYSLVEMDIVKFKSNTKYTFMLIGNLSNYKSVYLGSSDDTEIVIPKTHSSFFTFITPSNINEFTKDMKLILYNNGKDFTAEMCRSFKVIILEGDYTNKPLPTEAFTGIKSVGEEVTLTNLVTRYNYSAVQYIATSYVDNSKLKANDICTVVVDNPSEEDMRVYLNEDLFDKAPSFIVPSKSSIKYLATVKKDYVYSADAPQQSALLKNSITHTNAINYKACLIVGDYKNSNLEYFEGSIKKYKIETKSQNKNLFDVSEAKINLASAPVEYVTYQDKNCISAKNTFSGKWINTFKFKPNTQYRLTYNVYYENALNELKRGIYLRFVYTDGTTSSVNMPDTNVWKTITLISDEGKTVKCIDSSWGYEVSETKTYIDLDTLSLTEGIENVPYTPHKHHKKVILLDEPLRGIEGGAKDKTLKRESKLYLKRNFKEVEFKGLSSESWGLATTIEVEDTCYFTMQISDRKFMLELLCNKFTNIDVYNNNVEGIRGYTGSNHIGIRILKSKLETADVDGFKKWLQANPVTVVYQLVTPVYEEIKGLDNEFPTYAEVTHISTNTVIPCNQKIQNTGIECMLKPSTLYSIHDIRTGSGTAKYNLGGTINTSNKITTGATLTDNYLRLYGKGLTLKDVEVFEGDTPQTPYFSGMLSAFEDKKITQEMVDSGLEKADNLGKYRVGIKVVGKNKFDSTKVTWQDNSRIGAHGGIYESTGMSCSNIIKNPFLPGVKISCNASCIAFYSNDKENSMISREYNKVNINVPSNAKYIRLEIKTTDKNTAQLEEGTVVTQYEPYKEYKTSILLDSPLLKGDEICVQNGQLGVLHKMGKIVLDGTNIAIYANWTTLADIIRFETNIPNIAYEDASKNYLIADKVTTDSYNKVVVYSKGVNKLGIQDTSGKIILTVEKNKYNLSTAKQHLQDNPITTIYELEEPYFEPITPELPKWVLDIFDNSTISIDTIIPVESKFTYTSYIPSITAMQETNKNQDDLINVSLCATDEMYMMLEPLLQSVPQTLQINERMMSKMVDLYVAMVMRGLKTIDEVPLRYREEVKKILEQLDE